MVADAARGRHRWHPARRSAAGSTSRVGDRTARSAPGPIFHAHLHPGIPLRRRGSDPVRQCRCQRLARIATLRYKVGDIAVPILDHRAPSRSEGALRLRDARAARGTHGIALRRADSGGNTPRRGAQAGGITVDVLNNRDTGSAGSLALRLPQGWTAEPVQAPFAFARAGERASFRIHRDDAVDREPDLRRAGGRHRRGPDYTEGSRSSTSATSRLRYLYRPSTIVRSAASTSRSCRTEGRLRDGHRRPGAAGIAQLGYEVTLLDEQAPRHGDLSQYNAIVTGPAPTPCATI